IGVLETDRTVGVFEDREEDSIAHTEVGLALAYDKVVGDDFTGMRASGYLQFDQAAFVVGDLRAFADHSRSDPGRGGVVSKSKYPVVNVRLTPGPEHNHSNNDQDGETKDHQTQTGGTGNCPPVRP